MNVTVRAEPLKLSSLNLHTFGASKGAGFARARRTREVRDTVRVLVEPHVGEGRLESFTITRVGAGTLDDDNLVGACKPVLDGIADAFGLNDRSFVLLGDRPGIHWRPAQRSEGRGRFAVILDLVLAQDVP